MGIPRQHSPSSEPQPKKGQQIQSTDAVKEKISKLWGIAFVGAFAGFGIAWLAPEPRDGHPLMLLGWAIAAISILIAGVLVIFGIAHDATEEKEDK